MTVRTAWLSPSGQSREDTRTNQVGALTPVTESEARSGVLPGSAGGRYRATGLQLSGTAGTMSAQLGVGRAVVQSGLDRGAYPVAVTEPVPLAFTDGDAQYGRIDLVVLRIHDDTFDASGRAEAAVEIVPGTPAASPAAPAAPDTSLTLFSVNVPAGAGTGSGGLAWSTVVTDLRPTTVALGGILPTRADDTVPGGYPGHYRDTDATLQRWNGGAWVDYPKQLGGIAPNGALATGSYTGQYRDAPNGVLQRWNGTAWQSAITPSLYTGSLTGGTTTSTAYTSTLTGTSTLKLNFTAPSTGAVLLHFGARIWTDKSTTSAAFMTAQITQGATVTFAADDDHAAMSGGPVSSSVSTLWRMYGLTPGVTYTMTPMYRSNVAGVTCGFDTMFLRIDPAN
ncbi:hypothetical protein ACIREE_07610 [Streptomyces sp. NPDC102467]|uniref:hypothetical protein n=1 Tax=Streptomyces sp. NPDC102467 TaxID=3366179 RepID=UPI003822B610